MKRKNSIQINDTVLSGKRERVGNVVYFKTPLVAFVRYALEQSAFVPVSKLKRANGKLKPIMKQASKRREL
ncbi:MAG: hypothetical protein AB1349_10380 [Elusimicrobiota bacterium]